MIHRDFTPNGTPGIPEAREDILAVAVELDGKGLPELAAELRRIEKMMYRRKPVAKALPRSTKMTAELARSIRRYHYQHPEANYMQIGTHFNVSSGRVSEALAGHR